MHYERALDRFFNWHRSAHFSFCLFFIVTSITTTAFSLGKHTSSRRGAFQSTKHFQSSISTEFRNDFSTNIPVLFESKRILVIEKPHGVSHHSEDDELGILATVRNQLQTYPPLSTDECATRLYGVHRLDKVTSGILIFAKDEEMAGLLSKAFREKKIVKYYTAISAKKPKKKKQGWVKGNMVPSRRGTWKLLDTKKKTSISGTKNKSSDNYAATRFFTAGLGKVNELFLSEIEKERNNDELKSPKTVMLFQPITGKTHQIRVAAKSVGLPILGDERYEGVSAKNEKSESIHRIQRTYLHATALHLDMADIGLPAEGLLTVVSKPPFTNLWGNIDNETNDVEDKIPNKASEEFSNILSNLMKKHCECENILNKWME